MSLNVKGVRAMSRPIVSTRLLVAVVVVVCLTGCGGTASSPAGSEGPSVPATAAPATAAPPTAAPTVAPTMTPEPPAPSLGEPPAASLAVEGGDPVMGALGSFTWGGGGSDSPWLPGAPIGVGSGEQVTVSLAGDVPVMAWAAKRIPAGATDGAGAVALGDGQTGPITLTAPGPGRWSVQVEVTFGDDLGSAAYYWEISAS